MDDTPLSQLHRAFLEATLRNPRIAAALGEAVGPAVEAALNRALPLAIRRAAQKRYLTRAEAADYLGVSVRQVDVLRQRGRLAWTKRGGRVTIDVEDCDRYLAEGRVPTRAEG